MRNKVRYLLILGMMFITLTGFAPAKMTVNTQTEIKAVPNGGAASVGTVTEGETLRVTADTGNGWYQVLSDMGAGYVQTDSLTPIPLKINALGDSITNGVCVWDKNNLYYNVAGALCGAELTRGYGANGVSVAGLMPYNLTDRSLMMERDANLILVLGGTNDYYFSVPLGTNEDREYNTFYGSMHMICERLKAAYPTADIVFLTPLKRCDEFAEKELNTQGVTLEAYVNVIIDVCAQYQIPVIDTYREPTLDFTQLSLVYMPDGLHLDDASHLTLGYYVAQKLKELAIVY